MQMKVSVTSTMFTNLTCKLSKCVCEFRTECSQPISRISFCLSLSKCLCCELNTMHGYIYPYTAGHVRRIR
ncbi:hypothetical protein HanRHA438_Chr16g0777111 [Helianthus annuus]|nr:hypothetical protein HanRHA438_Chr16g0777111 [Helianthus annuus]